MSSMPTNISLYIHIPYCSHKCFYCDFYSEVDGLENADKLIDHIIEEMEYWFKRLSSPDVKTVFIGGGTPSLLPNSALEKLLSYVNKRFHNIEEWSIESNPESITKTFLNTCSRYSVNRLSVGIQSFNDNILEKIGREARLSDIDRALGLINRYWSGELNLDIISSLPNQSVTDIISDIERVIKINPNHISFYGLTIEEGTPLEDQISKGLVEELDDATSEDIWIKGRDLLKEAGYSNYEVSNFTKDSPCRHNVNYWELKPYLGVGPSAVSTMIVDGKIVRKTNPSSIKEYLEHPTSEKGMESINNSDFLTDYIMMGLRLKSGIDKRRFREIFHLDIEGLTTVVITLLSDGVLIETDTHLSFSEKSYNVMNSYLPNILDSVSSLTIEEINWKY